MNRIWGVLPAKALAGAKQRLSPALDPAQRRGFALAMLTDSLTALTSARGLAGVLVLTADPEVQALATRMRARILTEGAEDGHSAAVMAAARWLVAQGAEGMLAVPGDIPLLQPQEIEAALAAHGAAPAFTIAPAHDRRGSNLVICSPPDVLPLRYGNDSFLPHLEAARQAGITPRILELPGVALDVDGPEDLAAFRRTNPAGVAAAFLARLDHLDRR
jgi:2-phospho-L-lactate guanylyltransferase